MPSEPASPILGAAPLRTLADLAALTGRRVWFVRHICPPHINGPSISFHPSHVSRLIEWQVGPLLRRRISRGYGDNPDGNYERTTAQAPHNGHVFCVHWSDANRALRHGRSIALAAYLPELRDHMLPRFGQSAVFDNQADAETHQVMIALRGDFAPVAADSLADTEVETVLLPRDLHGPCGHVVPSAYR